MKGRTVWSPIDYSRARIIGRLWFFEITRRRIYADVKIRPLGNFKTDFGEKLLP